MTSVAEYERCAALLRQAYALLRDVTPRRFDCGVLCGGACCRNLSSDDSESGMLLLPYEREYLRCTAAGLAIDTGYHFETNGSDEFLICSGKCNRALRPFACRIFPYYPAFRDEQIILRPDPRAVSVCPLIRQRLTVRRTNVYFLRNVKKAANVLIREPVFRTELEKNAAYLDGLYEFYERLMSPHTDGAHFRPPRT